MPNNFNNPSEDLEISFVVPEEPTTKPPMPQSQDKPPKEQPVTIEATESGEPTPLEVAVEPEEEQGDPKEVDLSLKQEEPEEEEEPAPEDNVYLQLINELADLSIIKEGYDGFDTEQLPTKETLFKMIQHNVEKRDEEVVSNFYSNLSPLAQRIVSFDITSGDETVLQQYLSSLNQENKIKSLDPDNEYDQEQIVRTWYKQEEANGNPLWSSEEIEEKVKDLREGALLEKEARKLKPKLDMRAESLAREQEENEQALKNLENQEKAKYYERVGEALQRGEIGGIRLTQEQAKEIYSTLVVDEVPVRLPGGKTTKMSYLEALILQHKYHPKGNTEALAMAAWMLRDYDKFKQEFVKVSNTEVANKFVKDMKYNTKIAVAGNPKADKKKEKTNNIPWRLKI